MVVSEASIEVTLTAEGLSANQRGAVEADPGLEYGGGGPLEYGGEGPLIAA